MDTALVELTEIEGGCRIGLRVRPGAGRDRIVGRYGSRLKLEVAAPPEKGKANAAVTSLLATALDLPASRIRLVTGAASRDKVAVVEGCSAAELRRRLERVPLESRH